LLGLSVYNAQQRTKEIGVRKVLGASLFSILKVLLKDLVWLVVIALVIAFPLAWLFMNNWLQGFAYRTSNNWWVFVLSGVIGLFISLVTVSFQAIKAAIANPVKSLRTE
jgi:putative ABC transport system permease protein